LNNTLQPAVESDQWSQWLLQRRHGGDSAYRQRVVSVVERYRDRVLDAANLQTGMTLVDVGTGDGLLAFGAIERVGRSLQVILTDVSDALLHHTQQLAEERGVADQCRFLQGSAEKLENIANECADVVGLRAVLAYVENKPAAFGEFFRVLKPGGRLSMAEPVYQDEAFEACALANLIMTQPNHSDIVFLKLVHRYRSAQFPATQAEVLRNPVTNYNERDLFQMARQAGFSNIAVELHIQLKPALRIAWEAYLDVANHPAAPTLREILATRFSLDEAKQFTQLVRPSVEAGQSEQKELTVYLTATKPA